MDIKIGGAGNNLYDNLNVKNAQNKAQDATNAGQARDVHENEQSAKSVEEAAKMQTGYKQVSPDGDMVEISKEGVQTAQAAKSDAAPMTAQPTQEDTVPASQEGTSGATQSAQSNAAELISKSTENEEEEEDSESVTNLAQYTEPQLKQLYSDGKISTAEYLAELESRKQSSANTEMGSVDEVV